MKFYQLIIIALIMMACSEEAVVQEKPIRPVKYQKVVMTATTESQTFSGVVKAKNETHMSFKVAGLISSLKVNIGDRVKKGQLIASIDPVDYNIQVDQAVAQMNAAESQLVKVRSTYDRVEKLYESNSVSLSDYENAKAGLAATQSQYEAATNQVQAARNQSSYTRMIAPYNGIITDLPGEANEVVSAGRTIATLSSEVGPEVEVGVPEVIINKLKANQPVEIMLSSAPGKTFTGKIEQVAFAAGSSPTYPVTVSIDKATEDARPGMAAQVVFAISQSGAKGPNKLIAPVSAVGQDPDGNFVYVLSASGDNFQAKRRQIKVGNLLPEGFEVLSGLKADEIVATAGIKTLMDGMTIKLLDN